MPEPQDKMKKRFTLKTRIRKFQEGDKVLLLSPNGEPQLTERFLGPYIVALKIGTMNYQVNAPKRRKETQVCHANRKKKNTWIVRANLS